MARAFIVLCRNDLEDEMLQVLDLKPNATPSKGLRVYEGNPQGGLARGFLLKLDADGVQVNTPVTTAAGPPITTGVAAANYGLSGYLIDTVENAVGDRAATAANVLLASTDIEARVAAGSSLLAADINTILAARIGAGSALAEGNGTATLEEILRILAGEIYRVPAAAVLEDGGPNFIGARRGAFVTAANVEVPDSVRTTHTNARPLRGRSHTAPASHIRPGEPRSAPVQTGTQDTNFTDIRANVDTGHLHLSATDGVLAELKSATFSWQNPGYAYNAGDVTAARLRAFDIAGTNIPDTTFVGRAVVVYDALGNVI